MSKSITFDQEAQDNLPQEIKDKMKMNREKAQQQMQIKEIKKALVFIGFVEDGSYFRKDGDSMKIHENIENPLANIFKCLIEFGATQKVWAIKRALEV
jgi:uncharacterized secreted protein with C-terminal beta-propeller domain|tara:strand:+ start:217 stop:510 length:294 start_codon:yes stop_codon:yes gene_type:complete